MSATSVPTVPAERPRHDPGRVLWGLAATGWAILVGLEFVPYGHLAHAAHAVMFLETGTGARPLALTAFAAGWLVMVTAMMLPTTVPMARMFVVVTTRAGSGPIRSAFFGAYFVVWLGFAAVAVAGVIALAPFLGNVRPMLVLAGALGVAGVFQFSPLKRRCLAMCRDPFAFLFAHYRRGVGGAWALGVRHALYCLGCCWALMLVMFTTSVADLAWMLVLTAVMVVEKNAPWGHRVTAPVGIGLLMAAILFAVLGARVPMPMPMPM
jgi:predicted metal-binding membrane protein